MSFIPNVNITMKEYEMLKRKEKECNQMLLALDNTVSIEEMNINEAFCKIDKELIKSFVAFNSRKVNTTYKQYNVLFEIVSEK